MSMPETAVSPTPTAVAAEVAPFNREELNSFEQEDLEAGKLIGRLLCFFFAYTVVVCALAAWWTYNA